MTQKVFTVYDSKVGAYMQPFFMRSKGEALRAFESAVNDPQTMFCKHPQDYVLFEIGEYDELHGLLIPHSAPQSVVVAIELKKTPVEQVPMPFMNGGHRPQITKEA